MATTAHDVIGNVRDAAASHGFELATIRGQLDRLLRGAREAGGAASEGFHATDRYVRHHPWMAVAVAAGAMAIAGLVLAQVLRGRNTARDDADVEGKVRAPRRTRRPRAAGYPL